MKPVTTRLTDEEMRGILYFMLFCVWTVCMFWVGKMWAEMDCLYIVAKIKGIIP